MDDWEKYEQLADTPKYRDDFEFAMYGATHFGMKAIPILATAHTYGDKYPELIKAACEKSLSKGNSFGRSSDIDVDFFKRSAAATFNNTVCASTGLSHPSFLLKEMAEFSAQRITEIKAERLHERITSKLGVKASPPTRGIKI